MTSCDVASAADVIGVHVRDDDPLDRRVELVEHRLPALSRLPRAEAGVDEQVAAARAKQVAVDVVEPERQRERQAADPFLEHDHA